MADSMCGPSNPLQNFRKHTSADRTIQQDRFLSRQAPSSLFRSSPGPNAGLLDTEFEVFQAGVQSTAFTQPDLFSHSQHHFPRQTFTPPAPAAPAWALDFQRLNISQPQSAPFIQQSHPVQKPHSSANSWHHDFQRQHLTSTVQQSSQPLYNSRLNSYSNFAQQNPYVFSPPILQSDGNENILDKGKQKQVDDIQSSAEFDKAFEEHAAELLRFEDEMKSKTGSLNYDRPRSLDQEALMDDGSTLEDVQRRIAMLQDKSQREAQSKAHQHVPDQVWQSILDLEGQSRYPEAEELRQEMLKRMDEDFLNATKSSSEEENISSEQTRESEQEQHPLGKDDELAQTARELLEKVSDNTTEKFQQSSFLAMMRKLRDGEMRVDGDKMVEIEGINISSLSQTAPETTPFNLGRTHTMYGALRTGSSFNGEDESSRSEPPRAALDPPRNTYMYHHMVDDF